MDKELKHFLSICNVTSIRELSKEQIRSYAEGKWDFNNLYEYGTKADIQDADEKILQALNEDKDIQVGVIIQEGIAERNGSLQFLSDRNYYINII